MFNLFLASVFKKYLNIIFLNKCSEIKFFFWKPKIDSIEESYALGELDSTIYKKFKDKYETQKDKLQSKIENPSLSSSNLELAIDKALSLSASLEKIWTEGDLKNDKNCKI